jgi:hypothetical protein
LLGIRDSVSLLHGLEAGRTGEYRRPWIAS